MCLTRAQRLRPMPDTRRGLRILRELSAGERSIEQLVAVCGGTPNLVGAILHYHIQHKRVVQYPTKWRSYYRVTEEGRTYVDERLPIAKCVLTAKKEQLERLQEEIARETYRQYRSKNPHVKDLGFSQLTQTSGFLCVSDDNPYPACHGYPTGEAGCVFCGSPREPIDGKEERHEDDP